MEASGGELKQGGSETAGCEILNIWEWGPCRGDWREGQGGWEVFSWREDIKWGCLMLREGRNVSLNRRHRKSTHLLL